MAHPLRIISIKDAIQNSEKGFLELKLSNDHSVKINLNNEVVQEFINQTNLDLAQIDSYTDLTDWEDRAATIIHKNITEFFGEYDSELDSNAIIVTEKGEAKKSSQKLDCDPTAVLTAYMLQQNCPDESNEYKVFESLKIDREEFVSTLEYMINGNDPILYSHAGVISQNSQIVFESTTEEIMSPIYYARNGFAEDQNNYYISKDCNVCNYATYKLNNIKDLHSMVMAFTSNDLENYLEEKLEENGIDLSNMKVKELTKFISKSRGNVEGSIASILTIYEAVNMAMSDDNMINKPELRTIRRLKKRLENTDFKEIGTTMSDLNVEIKEMEEGSDIFQITNTQNNKSFSIPVELEDKKIPDRLKDF